MKRLVLVTGTFPYGTGETFLETEIRFLAEVFDEVVVYPALVECGDEPEMRATPAGVRVFPKASRSQCNTSLWRSLSKRKVQREVKDNCIGRGVIGRVVSCCRFDQMVARACSQLNEFLDWFDADGEDGILVYSYWLSTIGMTAQRIGSELRKRGVKVKVVARTHGFDLYSERAHLGYLPFQEKMLREMDAVYPCSVQGERYLQDKYPQFAEKISHAYLGVRDCFRGSLPSCRSTFAIVSCSNVISVKRVDLIARALAHIQGISIEWTHFGDGELLGDLQAMVRGYLPGNVKATLMGRVPNKEILDYYASHNVNLFVNVSESEGLPVSIMEACSFGIPIIATDVGGTSEVVEDGTNGHLLPKDFEVQQLVDAMLEVAMMDGESYRAMCQASRDTYLCKFSAEMNYTAFCQELVRIAEEA